jgi:hypothetical protein
VPLWFLPNSLARQKAKGEESERHRNHSETIGARDSATRQAQGGRIAAASGRPANLPIQMATAFLAWNDRQNMLEKYETAPE